ncbi:hypothetical protein N0B40_04115 [Chryseobacterium oranimense]|uniref:hypothetical protein n=1 Tax=Chryseobacterium oranimense TaxID=421058 RepID=UPI0021AF3F6A|nr:hypothetical protein [Chryseobacterium oranimense]UWX61467.1 hypothetical protein N0B40_04115 [Chryseobacterium oranimense]
MSKNKTPSKAIITLAYNGFTNIHQMMEESRSKQRSIKKTGTVICENPLNLWLKN